MEWNADIFGTFIKVEKGSEVMIEWLQNFYENQYEVQATAVDIVNDAVFDMFMRALAEKADLG